MPASPRDLQFEGTSAFMRLLGLNFERLDPTEVTATFRAGAEHHTPWGIVHGGMFAAVIETVATTGAYLALRERDDSAGRADTVVGVTNITDFLRPHVDGPLRVAATPIFQGRTQQLWEAAISRKDGKLVARGQVRLQEIDAK